MRAILQAPLAIAGALLLACEEAPSEAPSGGSPGGWDAATVEALRVEPQVLVDEIALTGQLEAEAQIFVQSEVAGIIASVEFAEGASVAKGQVLFRLRDAEQRALVEVAKAELALVRDVWERTQRLTSKDISSQARRAEAQAGLDEKQARLALAELELARTRIRAPFSGVTGMRLVAPGQSIDREDRLVSLAAIDRVQLIFTTQEMGVALARTGVPIHVRVASWPGERFAGEVFFVAPNIDPATRRLVMKAWLPNPEHRLKPGMFANVDILVSRKEGAVVIPESALVFDRHGVYVWRLVDAESGEKPTAEKIPVDIGLRQNGRVEILAGVAGGDVVVTTGTHKLKAGTAVDAVFPGEATARSQSDERQSRAELPADVEASPGAET